jgi:multiple sugar transport system permease protein
MSGTLSLATRRRRVRPGGVALARRWSLHAADSLFALPALVLVAATILVPGVYALYRSFFNWQPGYASPWVGLGNYKELLHLASFHQVVGNQFFLLLGLPLWTLAPLALAVVMHERTRFVGAFRSIFLFPAVLSPAIVAVLLRSVLSPDGMLNKTLDSVGLGMLQARWIDSAALVKPTIILVLGWANIGVGVIIFSAALSALPRDVLRAAEVDGAGWWARFFHIVLPSLGTVILFWMTYNVISVFLDSFGWIYVLTGGGPGYASSTMDFDIYKHAFTGGSFGMAAAECVVLVGIVLLIGLVGAVVVRVVRRFA